MTLRDFSFQHLKNSISPSTTNKWSGEIFEGIKSVLIVEIMGIILKNKRHNRGPKPNREIISKVLDALFEQLDNGSKICYLEKHYQIKRATYYRYLKIIIDNKLFESFHRKLLEVGSKPSMLLVDGTHIRSINGSERVNYGYKERSKMAVKVTILTGFNKVIYLSGLHPDNLNDHIAFGDMARLEPSQVPLQVLADSGYNGKRFKDDCKSDGYEIISSVRRWRNGPSHVLSNYHKILLINKIYLSKTPPLQSGTCLFATQKV